jgi:hypothetical protein
LPIFDFQLPIENRSRTIGNWKLRIGNFFFISRGGASQRRHGFVRLRGAGGEGLSGGSGTHQLWAAHGRAGAKGLSGDL